MKILVPEYYKSFHCKADRCRHSCCVGWEIDIDPESRERYAAVGEETEFGRKLHGSISDDGTPHFALDPDERCPFLTVSGLCEIYINLGEDALCEICAEHPRFRNFFSDRTETGLGLCCEEAAGIVLSKKVGATFAVLSDDGEDNGASPGEEEFFALRDELFGIIADKNTGVNERLERILSRVGARFPEKSTSEWCGVFGNLEILDPKWSDMLCDLDGSGCFGMLADVEDAPEFYANLAEYFLFRHLADGYFSERLREYAAFVVLGVRIVGALCTAELERSGRLRLDKAADIARMYSSEIEYDEDNVEKLIGVFDANTFQGETK